MQGGLTQTPKDLRGADVSLPTEVLGAAPSVVAHDPPALQEEMLSWLQGVSTAINESQSIRIKAQSLPLPSSTGPDASLGKKDKEKRFSFFPKKK